MIVLVGTRYILVSVIKKESLIQNSITPIIEESVFSPYVKKVARAVRLIVLFFFVPFPILYYNVLTREHDNCESKKNILGVSVTSFKTGETGGFSDQLINYLDQELSDSTLDVYGDNKMIPYVSMLNNVDTVNRLLDCRRSGLIVSGSNNKDDRSFYCNIYLHNMNSQCCNVRLKKKVILIRDPKLIELNETNTRVDIIGSFIKGLVFAYRCQSEYSLSVFDAIIDQKIVQKCPKLLAYAYLIRGNVLARSNRIKEAIISYKKGHLSDKLNEDLVRNYALLLSSSDNPVKVIKLGKTSSIGTRVKISSISPKKHLNRINNIDADTVSFSNGVLTISSNRESVKLGGVHIKKAFSINGKSYSFLMEERVPLCEEGEGWYSYSFRMDRNKTLDFIGFKKNDFKNLECAIWFFNNENNSIVNPGCKVNLSLTFSDGSTYLLPEKQLKVY